MLTFCNEAREVFANALLNPPAPNETLRKAADRYKKHVDIFGKSCSTVAIGMKTSKP